MNNTIHRTYKDFAGLYAASRNGNGLRLVAGVAEDYDQVRSSAQILEGSASLWGAQPVRLGYGVRIRVGGPRSDESRKFNNSGKCHALVLASEDLGGKAAKIDRNLAITMAQQSRK